MALEFFDCVVASAGIAGEFEALTEAEIAAAPGTAYSPPETGNFRVVAARVVQLLSQSPVYIETFQTSAAEVRVPSGLIASNDAADGRFYFIRNSSLATGNLTVQTHTASGSPLAVLRPGQMAICLHGDNDSWDGYRLTPSGAAPSYFRYFSNQAVPGGGTRFLKTGQGVPCSSAGDRYPSPITITAISVQVNNSDVTRTYDFTVNTNPSGTVGVTTPTAAVVSLPTSTFAATTNGLSVTIPANTEIGVIATRTSGSGGSSFNDFNVIVQFEVEG